MPSYEAWPTLRRTLSAALWDLRCLGRPWQLLVIDNESAPSLVREARRLGRPGEAFDVVRRSELSGRHFQPGAARNLGIERARHECLIFLDADCLPSRDTFRRYVQLIDDDPEAVFIGHRVFIDADGFDADAVAADRGLLASAPQVASKSNYGETYDRRLPELVDLDGHPRPYDCLFGCNFALHRDCLGSLRFDPAYDGFWGYEDIDLGLRLHRAGRRFRYAREAFVFHQEVAHLPESARRFGRLRNLAVLERRCPGFVAYRSRSRRAGALPDEVRGSLGPSPSGRSTVRGAPEPPGPWLTPAAEGADRIASGRPRNARAHRPPGEETSAGSSPAV